MKDTDLIQPVDRVGVATFELSTDDFAQALDWSETAAAYQSSYKPLIGNSETEFFMQFTQAATFLLTDCFFQQ